MNRTHGKSKTRTYKIWAGMVQRCTNENVSCFDIYGARGITVAPEWRSFESFLADMGERPDGMSIERIDNDKGYSKDNCRWATSEAQSQNRRSNRLDPESVRRIRERVANGEAKRAIAREMGLSHQVVHQAVIRLTWKNVA